MAILEVVSPRDFNLRFIPLLMPSTIFFPIFSISLLAGAILSVIVVLKLVKVSTVVPVLLLIPALNVSTVFLALFDASSVTLLSVRTFPASPIQLSSVSSDAPFDSSTPLLNSSTVADATFFAVSVTLGFALSKALLIISS